MANYHHQGPGPSSYYQQSPPHNVYAAHSPGPRPNFYPYPPAQQYHHHPPPPPRGNHPRGGGGGGGSYGPRGGHHYYQQQAPYPHAPLTAPHLYSPQSPKPYSPSYHYPSPNAPVFTPSWQQQPISPLPQQLSNPPFYEPPVQTPAAEEPPPEFVETEITAPAPSTPPPPSSPPPPSVPTPPPSVLTASSSYSHMGTISTLDESVSPPSSPNRKTASNPVAKWAIWSRRPHDPTHAPSIIISSNARPPPDVVSQASDIKTPPPSPLISLNPSLPPTTISSRVIDGLALSPKDISQQPLPPDEAPGVAWASQTNSSVPSSSVTDTTDTPTLPGSPASSHTSLSVASTHIKDEKEAVVGKDTTELEAAPQASTSAAESVVPEEEVIPDVAETVKAEPQALIPSDAGVALPLPTATTSTSTITSGPVTEAPAPAPASPAAPAPPKKSWASLLRPSTSTSSPGAGPSSSSTPSTSTRNALPTSSVVGFSIPAQQQEHATLQVSPSRRNDLVKLLSVGVASNATTPSGYASAAAAPLVPSTPTATTTSSLATTTAHSTGSTHIRPRGLINSGNMCFANSVLQILVYCPPFHRLFRELGRVLGGVGVGVGGGEDSAYPLVDATVEFLKEFVVDGVNEKEGHKEKGKSTVNANTNANASSSTNANTKPTNAAGKVASGSSGNANSTAGSSSPNGKGNNNSNSNAKGKGKQREQRDTISASAPVPGEVGWDGGDSESFLPMYVYDAMKRKKKFDGMRGGHQEDAEEFFGFYLDTLEEELLAMLAAVNAPPHPSVSAGVGGGGPSPVRQQQKGAGGGSRGFGSSTTAAAVVEERESIVSEDGDGWLEVGKRNRTVVTRTIKATESPITRIFGGKFRSTLRAPGQKDSAMVEDWRSLRLDIQPDQIHTIQNALSYISQPQTVQVTHASGATVDGQQQQLIEALPTVLVLHIKRFCYDTLSGGVVKVGKQVRFGAELDIGSDVMVPAAAKKSQPARYKLFGAVYHHGPSALGGHYTLDVLHPNRHPSTHNTSSASAKPSGREGWIRIDDDLVWDVRPEDVFGAWERDEGRCAYLLFYRRI